MLPFRRRHTRPRPIDLQVVHERYWMTQEQRDVARDLRIRNAEAGYRIPLNVMDGNYKVARDVCPWWDATAPARKTG